MMSDSPEQEPVAAPKRIPWWSRLLLNLTWASSFAALALLSTWPLPMHATTHLPVGSEPVYTVPVFNCWTMWWNAEAAATDLISNYWHAPIFHPERGTFAWSEPQPTMLLAAPLVWQSESPVPATNVYLWAMLFLNGWCSYRLLMFLRLPRIAAGAGGLFVLLLPYVHWQIGVLQLAPLCGIVWTLHALLRFSRRPTWWNSAAIGAAFGMSYWLCANHGLYFSTLLIVSAPLLIGSRLLRLANWEKLLLAAEVAIVIVLPVVRAQLHYLKPGFKRGDRLIAQLSLKPQDYLQRPWRDDRPDRLTRLVDHTLATDDEKPSRDGLRVFESRWKSKWMSPGYWVTLLVLPGVAYGIARRGMRVWTSFLLLFGLAGFWLSLGPHGDFTDGGGENSPYMWLVRNHPGYSQIRNVFRFGMFAQLAAALLAAKGVALLMATPTWIAGLRSRETPRPTGPCPLCGVAVPAPARICANCGERFVTPKGHSRIAIATGVMGIAIAMLAVEELFPRWQAWHDRGGDPGIIAVARCDSKHRIFNKRFFEFPLPAGKARWCQWLMNPERAEDVIVCLPASPGGSALNWRVTAWWMAAQTFHKRKMTNGYSGFFSATESRLRWELNNDPATAIESLRKLGVRHIVLAYTMIPRKIFDAYDQHPHTKRRIHDEVARILILSVDPLQDSN